MKIIITYILVLSGFILFGQDRYMVFFTDKNGSPYSLDNPGEFLTTESLQRRELNQSVITINDLPVIEDYVDQVRATGAEVFYRTRWMNGVIVQATTGQIDQINALSIVSDVEWVAPGSPLQSGRISKTYETEEDAAGTQKDLIGLNDMLADGFDGSGIKVAILDGGFPGVNSISAFSELNARNGIPDGFNFVENSEDVYKLHPHGTWVLSMMAAQLPDEFIGGAPGADYYLYITEDASSEYKVEEYNFLFAMERADSIGVQVVNASLGYLNYDDESSYIYDDLNGSTAVVTQAANWAAERGILFVNSAGNSGSSQTWPYITFPADCNICLAVGSVDSDGIKSGFSSIGPTFDGRIKPDIMAMGTAASMVSPANEVIMKNGTSMASPLIASLVAGLMQKYPDYTVIDLIDVIKNSGSLAETPNNQYGYGIPSYLGIVTGTNSYFKQGGLKIYPNPAAGQFVNIYFENLPSGSVHMISLIDLQGKNLNSIEVTSDAVQEIQFPLSDIDSGIYILSVQTENQVYNHRLWVR